MGTDKEHEAVWKPTTSCEITKNIQINNKKSFLWSMMHELNSYLTAEKYTSFASMESRIFSLKRI